MPNIDKDKLTEDIRMWVNPFDTKVKFNLTRFAEALGQVALAYSKDSIFDYKAHVFWAAKGIIKELINTPTDRDTDK